MNLAKCAKWTAGAAVILATLVVLFYSVLSLWGRREWASTQASLKAKGETLNIWELAEPEVPDAENFFSAPLWQNLEDRRNEETEFAIIRKAMRGGSPKGFALAHLRKGGQAFSTPANLDEVAKFYLANGLEDSGTAEASYDTILRALGIADAARAELLRLAARSGSKLPLDYAKGYAIPLPEVAGLLSVGQYLQLRATANAGAAKGEEALEDVLLSLRLADSLADNPLMICQLVRLSLLQLCAVSIWDCLDARCWTSKQIAQVEARVASQDLWKGFALCLRGERALFTATLEPQIEKGGFADFVNIMSNTGAPNAIPPFFVAVYPKGLLFDDLSHFGRVMQSAIDGIAEGGTGAMRVQKILNDGAWPWPVGTRFFSSLSLPAFKGMLAKLLEADARLGEAVIGCALERYRLEYGDYPMALADLPGLPNDPATGQAFRYEKMAEGGYRLWSEGADGKDDGGIPWDKKTGTGDWVWTMAGKR